MLENRRKYEHIKTTRCGIFLPWLKKSLNFYPVLVSHFHHLKHFYSTRVYTARHTFYNMYLNMRFNNIIKNLSTKTYHSKVEWFWSCARFANPGYIGIGGCGSYSVFLPHWYKSLANRMKYTRRQRRQIMSLKYTSPCQHYFDCRQSAS